MAQVIMNSMRVWKWQLYKHYIQAFLSFVFQFKFTVWRAKTITWSVPDTNLLCMCSQSFSRQKIGFGWNPKLSVQNPKKKLKGQFTKKKKNANSAFIFTLSCCSKPICCLLFQWNIKREIFLKHLHTATMSVKVTEIGYVFSSILWHTSKCNGLSKIGN